MTYAVASRREGEPHRSPQSHLGNGRRSRDRFRVSPLYEQAVPPDTPDVAAASGAIPDVLVSIRSRAAGSPPILRGEIVVVMAAMPAQLPYDAEIISVASRTWPDAATAFNRHRSHTIVAPLGSGENKFWRAPPPPWSAV
jgi:hypothetical protein